MQGIRWFHEVNWLLYQQVKTWKKLVGRLWEIECATPFTVEWDKNSFGKAADKARKHTKNYAFDAVNF
jgi:hypothetical protein